MHALYTNGGDRRFLTPRRLTESIFWFLVVQLVHWSDQIPVGLMYHLWRGTQLDSWSSLCHELRMDLNDPSLIFFVSILRFVARLTPSDAGEPRHWFGRQWIVSMILLLISHTSPIKTVTISSFTHVSMNIKTVRIWAHNLSKLVWHMSLMTCYIIIILPRGLRTPYVIVRDVPSRRRATHILTKSLIDNAGSIPFLVLVPTCWWRRCFLLRVSITIVTKTRFRLIVEIGFAYANQNSWLNRWRHSFLLEFRTRTSRKLAVVLVEFDCIITTTKTQWSWATNCWSNLSQLPYNEPLLTCYSTDPLHGDGAAAERCRPPTRNCYLLN